MKTTQKGFTLIELIVVIWVIGILAAIPISTVTPGTTSASSSITPLTQSQIQSYVNQTSASINRLNVPPPPINIITGSSTVPNCLTDLGSTAPSYTTPNLTVPSYTGSSSTAPSSTVPNCTGSSSAVP